jgi:peptidyl-prolyl cis-trans isomerase C
MSADDLMKKRTLITASTLLVLALVLIACGPKEENVVVARVGKSVLTLQELQNQVPGLGTPAARAQAELYIQHWIESELLYQEALHRGVEKRPEVQLALKKMTRDFIITSFVENFADQSLSATEEEIQSYYQEQKEEFQVTEDRYDLQLILVRTLGEAVQVRREIAGGSSFGEAARRYSIDGSRFQDGNLGFLPLRELSPLLAGAVARMRPGELSAPLKSEVGYTVIKLVDVQRKGTLQALDAVRPQIQQRIFAQKKEENYQQLIRRLSSQAALYSDLTKLDMFK